MKKTLLIILTVFSLLPVYAQNYGNGNGSIISEEVVDDYKILRRKHIQTVKMTEQTDIPKKCRSLWKDYSALYIEDYTLEDWGDFPLIADCTGKTINIKEIVKITSENRSYPYLFYAEVEGQTGYMRADSEECDFYDNGFWSIAGYIESSGRKWTIRDSRDSEFFYIKEKLFVRDKPGTNGTKKIYLFFENEETPENFYDGKRVKVKRVTEEKETIDGIEGRWLNIEYGNIEGWVFEGYVESEMWGYYEPEPWIEMFFTNGAP